MFRSVILASMPMFALAGWAGEVAGAVAAVNSTNPRFNPSHPPHIGSAFYPRKALALNEEGRCDVGVIIESDGSVSEKHIVKSTGSPRLDAACLEAFSADVRFFPATLDGKPVQSKRVIPVTWCLNGHSCQFQN